MSTEAIVIIAVVVLAVVIVLFVPNLRSIIIKPRDGSIEMRTHRPAKADVRRVDSGGGIRAEDRTGDSAAVSDSTSVDDIVAIVTDEHR